MKFKNKSILITGCSSGIGYETAVYLSAKGWNVIATCRKLKDVKKKTTVTVYEQGMMTETDWKDKKPGEPNKDKFEYKDNIYSWGATLDTLQIGYAIENINGDYHQSMILKMGDDLNLAMDSKCNIVDKKTFKKLIKNGVN